MNAIQASTYHLFAPVQQALETAAFAAARGHPDWFDRAQAAAHIAYVNALRFYREAGLQPPEPPADTARADRALARLRSHVRAIPWQRCSDEQLAVNDAFAILSGKPACSGARVHVVQCTGQPRDQGGHGGDDGTLLYWQHDDCAVVDLERGGQCTANLIEAYPE